jgi:hypothetical protein
MPHSTSAVEKKLSKMTIDETHKKEETPEEKILKLEKEIEKQKQKKRELKEKTQKYQKRLEKANEIIDRVAPHECCTCRHRTDNNVWEELVTCQSCNEDFCETDIPNCGVFVFDGSEAEYPICLGCLLSLNHMLKPVVKIAHIEYGDGYYHIKPEFKNEFLKEIGA